VTADLTKMTEIITNRDEKRGIDPA
jgi:hypothetical protein